MHYLYVYFCSYCHFAHVFIVIHILSSFIHRPHCNDRTLQVHFTLLRSHCVHTKYFSYSIFIRNFHVCLLFFFFFSFFFWHAKIIHHPPQKIKTNSRYFIGFTVVLYFLKSGILYCKNPINSSFFFFFFTTCIYNIFLLLTNNL